MGRRRRRIKAILLDLDGTLVLAQDWHKEALNTALIERECSPIGEQEHITIYNGLSTYRKLDMLEKQGRVDKRDRQIIHNRKQVLTVGIIKRKCKPVKRILKVMEYLGLIGMKTAVVTNCSRNTAELMLILSSLEGRFDHIVTNEDVDGKIKPHPRPYLLAKELCGLANTRKSCLAIDDTNKGIISAVDAQCMTWKLENFKDLNVHNLRSIINNSIYI